MAKKRLLSILVIPVFLFFSGCATIYNPATGRKELILINSETEVAIGKQVIPQLTREHPVSQDRILQERVERIGRQIAGVSDRRDIEYKFSALEDKELNALTLPGAFIFVNKGLADILDDNELAYVLGHEAGHVAARHVVKKIQSNMAYQLLLSIAFASMGSKAATATAQDIAGGVDKIIGLIALGYSRKDEYEADRLGAKYAFKAGFNPYAALSALEKIKKQEGSNLKLLVYLRTHPYADDRINALKKFIPQLSGNY